jgi:hypothetical protein
MNYNDIISLIVNDFNRSFNLSSEIIYDSRENIINKNPHFKIGKSAGGFLDIASKRIYLFSGIIEKIKERNYYNYNNTKDNGLTFLIFAAFHELEHLLQFKYPEKLRKQFAFSRQMYKLEDVIIKIAQYDQLISDVNYSEQHDNFLLEIDADIKGVTNALSFVRYYEINGINNRYLELMKKYNDFRINNYDIPIMISQFNKIVKKYPEILNDKQWLDCEELTQFYHLDGNLKSIEEIISVNSSLLPYFVSSISFLKSINGKIITDYQKKFIYSCLDTVINEHNQKQEKLGGFSDIDLVINELMNYTKVSGKNSKSSKMMANEKYYNYISKVMECFKEDKKIEEDNEPHLC